MIRNIVALGASGLISIAALATVLGWLAPLHPWFELLSNFRMQLFYAALLGTAVLAATRTWEWAGIGIVVLLINLISVFPYWTSNADAQTNAPAAQLLQYNIYFGNNDFDGIAEVITSSGAAVVAIHELTNSQWEGLAPLLDSYPHRVVVPVSDDIGELGGGMALLSQSPIIEVEVQSLGNTPERPILAIETEIAGAQTTVIGLHPHASRFSGAKVDLRDQQLDAVILAAQNASGPVVVMTDMNITPFSPDYKSFLRELDWRDPHAIAGWNATWPSFAGPFGTPIDHIFVSNDFALHAYDTGDSAGSDHLTLSATVSLPRQ